MQLNAIITESVYKGEEQEDTYGTNESFEPFSHSSNVNIVYALTNTLGTNTTSCTDLSSPLTLFKWVDGPLVTAMQRGKQCVLGSNCLHSYYMIVL